MRATTWLGFVALLAATGARADGGPEEIAKAHYALGSKLFAAQQYQEAVREFRAAYGLSPRADLLYNIGVTFDRLDDPGRATVYYQRYLSARGDAPERGEIEAALYRASTRVGKLVIRTSPGVEVLIDGEAPDIAPPAPLPLTAGLHRVEVRRAGCLPATAEVTIEGGLSRELSLVPQPSVAAQPAPLGERVDDTQPRATERSTSAALTAKSTSAVPLARRWWFWTALGAVVLVGAGVAIGVGLSGGSAADPTPTIGMLHFRGM